MKILYIVIIFLNKTGGKTQDSEKMEFCENLQCNEDDDKVVCGVRYEEDEVIFRRFDNECKLLLYGCQVEDSQTFGITSMKYCREPITESFEHEALTGVCPNCANEAEHSVCAIRREGEGFKVRTFENECQLQRHNCVNGLNFTITDYFICLYDPTIEEINDISEEEDEQTVASDENKPKEVLKSNSVVIVDGSMLDSRNINQSISNFFSATHNIRLPLKDVHPMLNESARKMMIRIFGPQKVFVPWISIPENISDDHWHLPTLSSCFHKCPMKCPETYAPVCGMPGVDVRGPSLMFQNHCFMDAAQCKMYWDDASTESGGGGHVGIYMEQAFYFCLGEELNGLSRFLPFLKTLQRLGRIKSKGYFRYKIKNMKWFNNYMDIKQPRFNG